MRQPQQLATDDLDSEQAITSAERSGWIVVPEDYRVQISASQAMNRAGTPDAWYVFMFAQPFHNAKLQRAMPLGCRLELLDKRLCVVSAYEPSDRRAVPARFLRANNTKQHKTTRARVVEETMPGACHSLSSDRIRPP